MPPNSNAVRNQDGSSLRHDNSLLPLEEVDQLVVQDQDERATDGAEHVGEVALEEGLAALVLDDLGPAVHRSL